MTQLAQSARLHAPAGPQDADPVTQPFGLGQDVAGQQHGAAVVAELVDARLEHRLHERVQARGRLVEQQQLHLGGQRGHDGHLLPVPLGVAASLLGGVEVETLHQLSASTLIEAAAQTAQQVDRLPAGQVRPEVHLARHVGEPAMQCGRLRPRVATQKAHPPGVGAQQT